MKLHNSLARSSQFLKQRAIAKGNSQIHEYRPTRDQKLGLLTKKTCGNSSKSRQRRRETVVRSMLERGIEPQGGSENQKVFPGPNQGKLLRAEEHATSRTRDLPHWREYLPERS